MTASLLLAYICAALLLQVAAGIGLAAWHWRRDLSHEGGATEDATQPTIAGAWQGWRDFRVARRDYEDGGQAQCSFYLEPADGLPLLPFRVGQFLPFELPISDRKIVRCYSLSDRPDPKRFRVTIKRLGPPIDRPDLPPGIASSHFHDEAVQDIGLRTTKGLPLPKPAVKNPFHQELVSKDCVACHSDHEGPKLTGQSRKPFSHALLRASSKDRCESCHVAPKTGVHTEAIGNCLQCHQQDRWKPATFDHAKLFLLDRDHNATSHQQRLQEIHLLRLPRAYPGECDRKQVKERIQNFDNCVQCHRSAHDKPREGRERGRGRD